MCFSGHASCPDGFCPEDLQACLQPARTTAAQICGCPEELFKSPCYLAQASALLKELFKTQTPRTGHNIFRGVGRAFLRLSPWLSQLSLSPLTRLLSVTDGRECIPQPCKELNNTASQNVLQKGVLAWQLFLKWICRSSKPL